MSAQAPLPIERRFADVRRPGSSVPTAGRRGNPAGLHPFRERHHTMGTELRSLEEGAEGARNG
jgi:hypothetical protein